MAEQTKICRENGVSGPTYYSWKSKYGGMEASDIKRLKDLEDENRRLKQMYAELSLDNRTLKEVDLNIPAQRVIRVLERIAESRGLPSKIRVDNGPEFVSVALADWC